MISFTDEQWRAAMARERAAHIETMRERDAAYDTIRAMQRDVVDDASLPTPEITGTEFIDQMMGRVR